MVSMLEPAAPRSHAARQITSTRVSDRAAVASAFKWSIDVTPGDSGDEPKRNNMAPGHGNVGDLNTGAVRAAASNGVRQAIAAPASWFNGASAGGELAVRASAARLEVDESAPVGGAPASAFGPPIQSADRAIRRQRHR